MPPAEWPPNVVVACRAAANFIKTRLFAQLFAAGCFILLIVSSAFWATLSAVVQLRNADQLVDPYLFSSSTVFKQAQFPGTHSFLIKWPLFWLVHMFGSNQLSYIITTVSVVLCVVILFCYVLWRLQKQYITFGGLCLALASVLLLVPAQPAAGVLLPVNMAMLATRNLEYMLYVLSLYLFIKASSWLRWGFGLAVSVAIILIASDKLFAALYIGSAILWLIFASLRQLRRRRWQTKTFTKPVTYLAGAATAYIGAAVGLRVINTLGLTHIVSDTKASPFALVHTGKQLAEAVIYSVGALLTNFGANPVHGQFVLAKIPHELLSDMRQLSMISYAVNFVIFMTALWATLQIFVKAQKDSSLGAKLTRLVTLSAIAAWVVYVITDHYYPVDARYVSIVLFSGFMALAVWLRTITLRLRYNLIIASVILLSLPFAAIGSWREYQQDRSALSQSDALTGRIAHTLDTYRVGTAIGDYWSVMPVKLRAQRPITAVPLVSGSCTQPLTSLISQQWLTNYRQPIAFVGLQTAGGNNYGSCSLAQLRAYYGQPSKQLLIQSPAKDGSAVVMIYNSGVTHLLGVKGSTIKLQTATAGVSRMADCAKGTTLNVVAHEDDDLLFLSPDLLHDVQAGRCITTVYLTAGDAGYGADYWQSRQDGSRAAYSQMYHQPNDWLSTQVTISGHKMQLYRLKSNPGVSLLFLSLPDGGKGGIGFATNHQQSLAKLRFGVLASISSLDGQANYTYLDLIKTLKTIMNIYKPDQIRTQDYSTDISDGDHSDHHATGFFTKQAYIGYKYPSQLKSYAGYPAAMLPDNVSGEDANQKQAAFLEYAQHDGAVCQTFAACDEGDTYKAYVMHQYSKLEGTDGVEQPAFSL